MRCKKCGISLKEGAKFCPSCGTRTEPDTAPAAAVSDMIPCPGCGQPIKKDAKFCPFCGAANNGQNEAPKCKSCGAELKPGVKFCPSCGSSTVSDSQPQPLPVPAPSINDAPPAPSINDAPPVPSINDAPPAPSINDAPPVPSINDAPPVPSINDAPPAPSINDAPPVPSVNDTSPVSETKSCPHCGKELKATAKFCPFCGEDATAAPKAEEPVAETVPETEETPSDSETKPCPHCGKELKATAKFCPFCGGDATAAPKAETSADSLNGETAPIPDINSAVPAAQGTLPQINTPAPSAQGTFPQTNGAVVSGQKNKYLPFILMGIGGVIVIAIIVVIIVAIVSNQKKEIDVSQYIDIRVSENAYDGEGYAELEFNSTKFSEDWKDQLKYSKNPNDYAYSYYIEEDDPSTFVAYVLKNNYCYTLDKSDNLSNGDTVSVKWEVSDSLKETIAEYVNCELVFSEKSFTIDGLKGLDKVDLFEGVDVEFTGQAPNGSARVTGTSYYLNYSLDKEEGLSNGDKVTVTISAPYSDEDLGDYMRSNYHATFSETSKTFTVSGLTKTVTTISEIDDESLTKMKHETEDLIQSDVANEEEATLKSVEYLGMIILSPKNSDSYYDYLYYTVYKVDVSVTRQVSGKKTTGTLTYYTYGKFSNLVIVDDKISSDFSASNPYSSVYYDNTWISFNGYKSLDALTNDIVTKQLDKYTSESNVEEKKAAVEPSQPEESSKVEESSKEESGKVEESGKEESSKAEESSKVEESSKAEESSKEESSKTESSKEESSKTESSKKS